MLLPALQEARKKAKYARWVVYSKNLSCEPNLVAYWTFEEGEGDALKNKAVGPYGDNSYRPEWVNGEIVGATWVTGRWPGKSALYFTNKDEYVVFPKGTTPREDRNPVAALTLEGNGSFEAWVKRIDDQTTMRIFVASYDGGRLAGMNYLFYVQNSDPRFLWGGRDGDKYNMIYNAYVDGTEVNVSDGNWHHVVAVIDDPNARMYIDGEEATMSGNTTIQYPLSSGQGEWGEEYVRIINYYHVVTNGGYIDELAVYNRALTASEVKQHYRMGKP